ncbi:MAG: hypothetical protein UW45_C0055G0004 [Parcubacteria group bacterium GW2011_GWC2_44_22]|nr:MAG: hypothetical protein UW45_C0055G0004 [Parcubacteria group bacterium GW2011_GWC2_44_22]
MTKRIYIKPQKLTDEEDYVELSETGEKMLQEALAEVKAGKAAGPFDNVEDLMADLNN